MSAAIGAYFYPQMPDVVASHWNAGGQVDGYTSRFWGAFALPLVSLGVLLLLIAIPRVDPLRANIETFRSYYDWLIAVLMLFLLYLHLLTIVWNLGTGFNILQFMSPAVGALFYYVGILIGKAKKNWSIGIRTPWTLSSDRVWEDTHRIGGRLFKFAGLVAMLGILFPAYSLYFVVVPVILVALYTVLFSYIKYREYGGQ